MPEKAAYGTFAASVRIGAAIHHVNSAARTRHEKYGRKKSA
jgi:hypothetical protein